MFVLILLLQVDQVACHEHQTSYYYVDYQLLSQH